MVSYGTLTFSQDNANVPVHITGTLTGLNISSAHVCWIKKKIFESIFYCRVFIFIQIRYQMVRPIVQLLVVIWILTVNREILKFRYKIRFSLDTTHGPRTANITSRHVGDLGNITTDAFGTVTLDMYDWIIQLYNATQSITDRTVIVHLFRDDGGQGGFSDSTTTGYDYIIHFFKKKLYLLSI